MFFIKPSEAVRQQVHKQECSVIWWKDMGCCDTIWFILLLLLYHVFCNVFRFCVFVFYLPICADFVIGICAMIQHINKLIFSYITAIRFYERKTTCTIKFTGNIWNENKIHNCNGFENLYEENVSKNTASVLIVSHKGSD